MAGQPTDPKTAVFDLYDVLRADQMLLKSEIGERIIAAFPDQFGESPDPDQVVNLIQAWARQAGRELVRAPQGRKAGKSPFRKADFPGIEYGKKLDEAREAMLKRHHDELAAYDESMPGHLYRNAEIEVAEMPRLIAYTWDLETTNLNSFLGKLIVASFLDMSDGEIHTRTIHSFEGSVYERERQLVEWVLDRHEEADVLIGHNTLGFDNGFIRGRIEALQMNRRLPKRHHWDTMQIAKFGFKGRPQGAGMENLADFFRLPIQKDKPSKHDWADSIWMDPEAIERITYRCEEDVRVNALLWAKLRGYAHEWRGK